MQRIFDAMDKYPAIPVGLFLAIVLLALMNRKGSRRIRHKAGTGGGMFDQVLFWWSPRDPLTVRDLLRSVAVFGASGSGKTSGSGYQLARAIVMAAGLRIGGLILASKPEDREFWERIFRMAGRRNDLLVFGPDSPLRFNYLNFVQRSGGDTRDITQTITVIGETLEQSNGHQSEQFWAKQNERMIYNAVEIVRRATGNVTAPDMQRFINGAAQVPAALATPEWQAGFHNQCLQAAFGKLRTSVQRHDYASAADFWLKEYGRNRRCSCR